MEQTDVNVIDAAGRGTGEGLQLALNVGAMLISFLALIALVNYILGFAHLSLQQIFGWVFAPVAWSMGVPWRDAPVIGNLLGTRMVLNEFVAYSQLGPLKASLDPKSFTIATFALCGFANFSSIGIQIGGIGALAPESAPRSRAARSPRDVRRHARQLHDRDHRRLSALMAYYDEVKEAADAIRSRMPEVPAVAIVLGSGLGDFAGSLGDAVSMPYGELPHWPASGVIGHDGKLVVGTSRGRTIAALAGRCHAYEGHDLQRVTFAVRALGLLGVKTLLLTNAAGGVNTSFSAGRVDGDRRSLNLTGANPLVGPNDDRFGARFPDMTEVYSVRLRRIADEAGSALGLQLPHGVYAGADGTQLRNAGRDSISADDRR